MLFARDSGLSGTGNNSELSCVSSKIVFALKWTGLSNKDRSIETFINIMLSNNIADKNITVNNKLSVANEAIALTSTVGGVKLTGKSNTFSMETTGDVKLTSNTAATDNIVVTNTKGTAADAINLEASAGGVLVSADGNLANAIKLHATAGTSQTINLLNTAGTNDAAIDLTASKGGVKLTATDGGHSKLEMETDGAVPG